VFLFPNRPKFILEKGGDSSEYAYVCWKEGAPKVTEFRWLPSVPLEVRQGKVALFDHPKFRSAA
jgi:hypothetical protein